MLPRKCTQPPCRNIDVNTVSTANRAGTTPYACMNCSSVAAGQRLLEEERETVEDDEDDGEKGKRPRRNDVAQRNHAVDCVI